MLESEVLFSVSPTVIGASKQASAIGLQYRAAVQCRAAASCSSRGGRIGTAEAYASTSGSGCTPCSSSRRTSSSSSAAQGASGVVEWPAAAVSSSPLPARFAHPLGILAAALIWSCTTARAAAAQPGWTPGVPLACLCQDTVRRAQAPSVESLMPQAPQTPSHIGSWYVNSVLS